MVTFPPASGALEDLYARMGDVDALRRVLGTMDAPNVVSYTAWAPGSTWPTTSNKLAIGTDATLKIDMGLLFVLNISN